MKIAITTPAGRVGSKVTRRLLSEGAKVVLLAHNGDKVREFLQWGAEIRQGSLDDPKFVIEATSGVETLFWVTPANPATNDVRGFQNACGHAAAAAIRSNHIPRVVDLSSLGAHLGRGTGPVNGLHDVELLLDAVATNIIHLRPGWFFENFLMQLDAIRLNSAIYLPISGTRRLPMIATRDIAAVAGTLLLDESWRGHTIRGLHGPADLSFPEAAEQLTRGLGRPVGFERVAEDQARKFLMVSGLGRDFTELMLEMYRGFDSGWMKPAEVRTAETTTPTTLEEFAGETMAPLLRKETVATGH